MSSQFRQFIQLQKDSRTRAIETRMVALTGFFLGYIFFFRLGRTNKAAAWAVTGYLVLSIITLVFSSWLDYFPMKLKEMRVRVPKNSGLTLGCLLAPMAVTATLVCSSYREPRQEALLSFYVILSCSLALASILATLFHAFPNPTNVSMYLFTVFGMSYGIGAFWEYTLPGVKPPAPLFLNISLACVLYAAIVGWLLSAFEGSFSLCEACTVGQGLALTTFDILMCLLNHAGAIRIPVSFNIPRTEVLLVLEMVVLTFLLSSWAFSPLFHKVEQSRSDPASYRFWSGSVLLGIGLLSFTVCLSWLQALMGGKHPIAWLVSYIFQTGRIPLMLYWTVISSCAILVVIAQSSSSPWLAVLKAKDPTSPWFRKWFHLLALLIFVPGIAVDPGLTTLASTAALGGFLLVEFIRYLRLWPLGETFHTHLDRFADSKDAGPLVLTHIYLLLGFALPLWLYPLKAYRAGLPKISLYAGVLALGVGDSLASIVGKSLGKWKITGTHKTVEGACASIVGQALVVTLLPLIDPQVSLYLYSPYDYLCLAASIAVPAFLEAFTVQIDNLILSLFQFSLLLVSYT